MGGKLIHSYSPEIHKKIFEIMNMQGSYELFELQENELEDMVKKLKSLNYKGCNVTIPHKISIMDFLDEISHEAKKIGAVNVIAFNNGKACGYNTDYYGFGMALQKNHIRCNNEKAVVLGTGGASRAIVQYLVDNGAKDITLVSTDKAVAKEKYPDLQVVTYKELEEISDSSLIINCTPVGMYPKIGNSPVEKCVLKNFGSAVDIIYNPRETVFLKDAKELGLNVADGMYMLVAQAVKSQEIWNNISIPQNVTEKITDSLR